MLAMLTRPLQVSGVGLFSATAGMWIRGLSSATAGMWSRGLFSATVGMWSRGLFAATAGNVESWFVCCHCRRCGDTLQDNYAHLAASRHRFLRSFPPFTYSAVFPLPHSGIPTIKQINVTFNFCSTGLDGFLLLWELRSSHGECSSCSFLLQQDSICVLDHCSNVSTYGNLLHHCLR